MSPRKQDYPTAIIAWCPECDVNPEHPCRSLITGKSLAMPHRKRVTRGGVIQRGNLKSPLRPGELIPETQQPLAEQLPLVGYEPETPGSTPGTE